MTRLFVLTTLSLLSIFTLHAQQPVIPDEVKPFIIPGLEVLRYIKGDVNNDKRPDAILVLKQHNEDNLDSFDVEHPARRPMLILIRGANGKLSLAARNDEAVMCRQCGGVFGDPLEDILIRPSGFELLFYGGSNWRWSYQYLFRYNPNSKEWKLVREKQVSYFTGNPDKTMKTVLIPEGELGSVGFEAFNAEPTYPEQTWKVKAQKAYFYSSPNMAGKPGKAYVIKNENITTFRELKNFIHVSYTDKKGNTTEGFLLKKDLAKQ